MLGRQLTLVAVAAALTGAAGSASAQDAQQLQDMKRVIEQQQKQIEAQQQALEDMRRRVDAMQQQSEQAAKTATEAQDAATRAQKTAEATAQTPQVTAGQPKIKLQVYGQINQMVNTANDGKSTKAYFLSNNNSAPRLGIVGKAQSQRRPHDRPAYRGRRQTKRLEQGHSDQRNRHDAPTTPSRPARSRGSRSARPTAPPTSAAAIHRPRTSPASTCPGPTCWTTPTSAT